MKRAAITIIYNGLHHLKHNDFSAFMVANFDYWIVVDGFSRYRGMNERNHGPTPPPTSTDGTVEFMNELQAKHENVFYYTTRNAYRKKDEQFNKGLLELKRRINQAWLWQVDVDEQWDIQDIEKAEEILAGSRMRQAAFQFNHYVGEGIVAQGDWGSHYVNRLFQWRGQRFMQHIPARLYPENWTLKIENIRFNHYSYIFAKDVEEKAKRYEGHGDIYENWKKLQKHQEFPAPITLLFPPTSEVGRGNTQIIKL